MIFVVPCRYNSAKPIIEDCVRSIYSCHPDDQIVVVDSDSPDKSYFEKIKNIPNLQIENCANVNYVYGALWHVTEKFDSDHYFLIHDSMIIKSNISFIKNKEIGSARYFRSWNGVGGMMQGLNMYGPSKTGVYRHGFDNQIQKDWCESHYKPTNMFFNGLFGCSFMANRDVISFMKDKGMDKAVPTSKNECMATERMLGSFFTDNNLRFWENCLLGEHHEKPYENQFIKKIIMRRG